MGTRTLRLLLFGLVLGLLASQSAFADVYATIRGTVTDPSGAVVAGAQVTATNTLTGVSKTVTSQANGAYEFLQLPTGPYTVTVKKSGFKTFKSTAFTLTVNQIYALTAKLEVGEATETVEVTANPVQVERTSIQQSTLINSQQIVDLPLNGRNFTQLEQLAPGVMASSDRFGTFSVNGSQSQQSSYLINGTDTNDIALNTPGFLPSPDAIQEFNLISSTINPEYGRNSGGIVNAMIKSGTNNYHGDVFDFYRDTFLNSRGFFSGPDAPVFHQNQFGGTFGGPIKKDKTFFFLSYQGTYNRVDSNAAGQSSSQSTTVLSPDQRNGIFPDLASSNTVAPIALIGEDGTLHPANSTTYAALFPTGHIPVADFNSVSAGLINQFVPLPNSPNNQFTFNPVNTGHTDQGIAKIDHNLTANDQLWGVFGINNNRSTQALPFTGADLPGFGTFSTAKTYDYTAAWNHTFNSTMLNEFRLGYFRFNFDAVEPQQVVDPSTFGFTNIKVQDPAAAQLPVITVGGAFTLGFSNNGPQPRKDENYQLTDNFSKIIGNHTLKFGFDGRRFQVDNPFFFLIDGNFGFNGNGAFSSGDPLADFVLGVPDGFAQGSGASINARAYEYYAYGQDQWKVKENLTLTLGAGYQIDTPYHNNQFGGEAFNCLIPGQQSTIFPTAPAGMNFPGDPGCNNAGVSTKYGHIAPRFGFVYSPDQSKTSIRGGVGVYYNRYEEETALQNLGAPPFGLQSQGVADAGGSPSFADPWTDISGAGSIANKFPFTPPAVGSPVDFTFFEPMGLNTIPSSQTTPRSVNFNLNIERELPGRTVVSLGYVGAMGRHLYRAYDQDPITLAGAQACLTEFIPTPNGPLTCLANRNIHHFLFPQDSVLGANVAQCGTANNPFGDCFGSWGTQFTDGTSNYNAFQANVTKGITHGLSMIVSYTWSHSIDDGSGFENSGFGVRGTNPFFNNLNVGDSGFDARQRLVISPIYNIPSLHNLFSGAPEAIFGGWRISSIMTFQTGFPLNFSDSGFRSLTCDQQSFYGCPDNPNQLVSNVQVLDPRGSADHLLFDTNDFGRQAFGTFGNTGRNSLHALGINNFDMSLTKDTKMTEHTSFQIGMDLFNVFNHTQFNQPSARVNSAIFGQVTGAAPARIAQLRAKINF
ncbi:MAG TPA: carboxypeptidase regulatory-like domain-containing protein [Candidatus Angelobacter sp.]|nr:carboxypeptidase regulatory-like domain-containing protein [Candidatus Angelobacter sp.]